MTEERIALVDPTAELAESFLSMLDEYAQLGEDQFGSLAEQCRRDFAASVRKLHDAARGAGLPPGWVPYDTYWLVRAGRTVLGTSRLRHRLSEELLHGGGHIGYDIRPSERRKGYGTRILALTLERTRARGVRRALVTCLADNVASARVIENNGGVLEDEILSESMGGPLKRYWIDL